MNFDLNIGNYSREELVDMFDLPSNYDSNIVEMKETQLRNTLMNNKEINQDTLMKTIQFLVHAKQIILKDPDSKNDKNINSILERFYNTDYSLQSTELESKNEHMVQVTKDRPYSNSLPSEYFAGIINPLKRKTRIQVLNIDSKFRDNYYNTSSTNFNINLPMLFTNIAKIVLNAIEIPTSYYNVSKQYGNNYFTISVNGNNGVINLPDGNYSRLGIIECINKQISTFTTVDPDFAYVVFSINLGADIENNTSGSGQAIAGFNGGQTPNATLELNFQADRYGVDDRNTPLPLKLGWTLGFRNGVYVNNINYVSEGLVDTSGSKYFFLVLDDYNTSVNNGFFSAFNSSMLNKNILARISLQTNQFNPFNLLEQNNLSTITTPRDYFGPVNIQNFTVQLLDEYGRTVDLNNMDFSFCISLTTIYDL
jgi:hypothetical protein